MSSSIFLYCTNYNNLLSWKVRKIALVSDKKYNQYILKHCFIEDILEL